MPKVSKVKRIAGSSKPGNVSAPKELLEQYICSRCGRIYKKQKSNFSPSYSALYRGNGGYLPVCVNCMDELLDHYKEVLDSESEAIRRLCMKFDIYWNPKIYAMVYKANTTTSRIRSYLSKCNLSIYVGKTYDDTIDEEAMTAEAEAELAAEVEAELEAEREEQAKREAELEAQRKAEEVVPVVYVNEDGEVDQSDHADEYPLPTAEVVEFWGAGLTPDYYYMLQKRFDKWTANKPKPLDPGTEALYKQVCICEEQVNRGIISGIAVDKPQNTMNSLLGSLNEKPTQKIQEETLDADFEKMTFGMGIKAFENTRPIPKADPEFEDVDGIRRYISVWFLGHLCSMLNIRNSYCRLYEEEMARLRVERPDLAEEDDDAVIAADIFGEEAL